MPVMLIIPEDQCYFLQNSSQMAGLIYLLRLTTFPLVAIITVTDLRGTQTGLFYLLIQIHGYRHKCLAIVSLNKL